MPVRLGYDAIASPRFAPEPRRPISRIDWPPGHVKRKQTRREPHCGKKVERSGAKRQALRVTGPDIPGMDLSNLPAEQFPSRLRKK